ncbi:TPA: HTH-type transcriptional regulator HdfR [Yersinia enterocolitica]|uniref:HTH-type transcriptional regulator HdfR n=2 Tax=Yersinia enterocolitica TaxID=630 RepID=A0A0H3P0X8_YERE1|nr:HTH-type transcriptional regulator HdfR [Yersinia enterocolitica]EHB20684.1 transcriptional regulator HdfR [Yersinia enterocolitica subsp. palearctica PhRBD_Ye1]EKN3315019.1 HTH-type transcriptional regulator HdfR [Yersinia enterocolitica]EKN3318037.1 HTH-type transcriptional regulator HdfR [Yersinia enterocolitica]EKN3322044.1 HTH-type transcriptional regulator HdfR [Yersinia enterocolitica]EKN3334130.1 HTH-type transcriptional regulator HdfR [Yersinia enterocolitica]
MDTELLKTFLEVSRTRHFGRAAESLYLTQSAVSFRIRQLENQLGANLFTRHRNNIRLTPAGERLLPYAETLMSTWQLAKKEVAHSLQHTELSIGATASLWEAYLTPWLQQLYKQREALRLEARIALRQSLVKQLHERQLDLLITTEPPKMDELASLLLGHFSLRLFSSVSFELPEKTDDETEHKNANEAPYIKLEWGEDFHQQESRLLNNEQMPMLTTTSAHLTRQLLDTTGGCAFLPEHWQKEYPELIVNADIPSIVRPLYAVWLQNSDQQTLIRQLLKTPMNNAAQSAIRD